MLSRKSDAIREDIAARVRKMAEERARLALERTDGVSTLTLERLCEDPTLGDLPLSPAQRAFCRVADGLRPDLSAERMHFHFGLDVWPDEAGRPLIVLARTGVRGGKSLIASGSLLRNTFNAQFRRPPKEGERPGADGLVGVRKGEYVRAVIVAPYLRLTKAPFEHLKGTLAKSERLSRFVVGEPNTERVRIRRPDGNEVDIEPVAAAVGGANLRSTWVTGALFDEADFHDDEGHAVDLVEQIRACTPRMLPGGQIWIVSSPFTDSSQFHQLFTDAFGHPLHADGSSKRTVAFHSDTLSMNPTFDRSTIEQARKTDPDQAACEYDAVPRTSGSLNFFPHAAIIAACSRPEPFNLQPNGAPHWAGSDLGLAKNSSALALAHHQDGKTVLAYYEERIPVKGQRLSPSEVCASFAATCVKYKATSMRGDNHYGETAVDEFRALREKLGVQLTYDEFACNSANMLEVFTEFKRRMLEGLLVLPADPRLIKQLTDTKIGRAPGGGVKVVLPIHGAAHGDLMLSIVLACVQVPPRAPGHVERGMSQKNVLSF